MARTEAEVRAAVESNPLWYHTLELAPGVVTPGWFDYRPVLDRIPWPDVTGKRCLDVGTYDGQLAYELERRGASEVVATDIADHTQWDWPRREREKGAAYLRMVAGEKGRGFEIASELLGSSVRREWINIYELSPERLGTFDLVICGSLMLHLRDPMRGLEAIRSVCDGQFLSVEQIAVFSTLLHRRKPIFEFEGMNERMQWFVPNAAAHRAMVSAAGFEIEKAGPAYAVPFGPAHRFESERKPPRVVLRGLVRRVMLGNDGVPHRGLLARAI